MTITIIGSIAACIAAACGIMSLRRSTVVERRLRQVSERTTPSPLRARTDAFGVDRLVGGACGAMAGAAVAWSLNIGPLPIAAATYLGMLAPAKRNRRDREGFNRALEIEEIEPAFFARLPMWRGGRTPPQQNSKMPLFLSRRRQKHSANFEDGDAFRARAHVPIKDGEQSRN